MSLVLFDSTSVLAAADSAAFDLPVPLPAASAPPPAVPLGQPEPFIGAWRQKQFLQELSGGHLDQDLHALLDKLWLASIDRRLIKIEDTLSQVAANDGVILTQLDSISTDLLGVPGCRWFDQSSSLIPCASDFDDSIS